MAAVAYRGTVASRGDTIILEEGTRLPLGTEVLVTPVAAVQPRRGSPQALLAAMRDGPRVTREDVEELLRVIHESRGGTDWRGVFDERAGG